MKNEIGEKNYRILYTFFNKKIPVHFRLYSGGWKNGVISDLNLLKLTLILDEFIEGKLPILLENIVPISIIPFRKRIT